MSSKHEFQKCQISTKTVGRRCSAKKVVLTHFANSHQNNCAEVLFLINLLAVGF